MCDIGWSSSTTVASSVEAWLIDGEAVDTRALLWAWLAVNLFLTCLRSEDLLEVLMVPRCHSVMDINRQKKKRSKLIKANTISK